MIGYWKILTGAKLVFRSKSQNTMDCAPCEKGMKKFSKMDPEVMHKFVWGHMCLWTDVNYKTVMYIISYSKSPLIKYITSSDILDNNIDPELPRGLAWLKFVKLHMFRFILIFLDFSRTSDLMEKFRFF